MNQIYWALIQVPEKLYVAHTTWYTMNDVNGILVNELSSLMYKFNCLVLLKQCFYVNKNTRAVELSVDYEYSCLKVIRLFTLDMINLIQKKLKIIFHIKYKLKVKLFNIKNFFMLNIIFGAETATLRGKRKLAWEIADTLIFKTHFDYKIIFQFFCVYVRTSQ